MIPRRRCPGFALALLAVLLPPLEAAAAETPALADLLPREAEIRIEDGTTEPRLERLVLPPEVLAACRPDLSDLRIFDREGREVPYLIDRGPGPERTLEVRQSFRPEMVRARQETSGRPHAPPELSESYELDAPPRAPESGVWELVLSTPRASFVRRLEVALRGAEGALEPLAEGSVFHFPQPPRERLRLALPDLPPAARVVVTLSGEGGQLLEPVFHFESARELPAAELAAVSLVELSRRQGGGRTVLELERPRGLVPERLRLVTATPSFQRPLEVWDEGSGARAEALGRGAVFRLVGEIGVEELELPLLPPRGDRLRLVIEDGDSPPLSDLGIQAVVLRPALVFDLPPAPPEQGAGTLRFGGGRTFQPRYDLERLAPSLETPASGTAAQIAEGLYDPSRLGEARLGPAVDNPRFDPAPALAFAHRAGAAIDPHRYSHRRRLDAGSSGEGLHHLRLELEELARARPDLADLRVTDGEARQWAYLLEPNAGDQRRPLAAEGTESRDGRSRITFPLPVVPAAPSRLLLETELAFFDRAFELRGVPAGGGEPVPLAHGRLVRRLGDPRPVAIHFPPRRLEALMLEIEDGDDAPIPWGRAEAGFPVPELYFAAPAGSYALLVGNPEAQAPRYELERVRGLVLAVESLEAGTGPLEPNPDFRRGLRWFGRESSQKVLLWVVVILAVVVLAALTLRLVRQEGEG